MKKNILVLVALSGMMTLISCEKKIEVKTEIKDNQEVVATDTIVANETPAVETKTVEGKVVEITPGKDGYTAKLETAEKEHYYVTISHSNLTNHEQYKSVNVGETLKVTGDFWKMENDNQITVRVIE
ncbi:hypothetical protein J2X31_001222 [Flavobacterium arsenatis]|uniref:Lipoprotein n=1 Tax=Flavobacterium arsenatis TaxID=1484332 RepID=A0ABU1TMM2_9FLAO|nr:hypothetical protein [Flavobacterium arsenatis]MDR6967215.1 hypothetical protein [Flavobacterium arsenatis]